MQRWTTIIDAKNKGSFVQHFKEIAPSRDIIAALVRKDIVASFKQTYLGWGWIFLNPIVHTLVFSLVLGHFAGVKTDGIPHILFYLSGIIFWNFFANSFISISNIFIANMHLINRVHIPKMVLPISALISALLKFIVVCLVISPVFMYYGFYANIVPNYWLYTFPVLVLILAIFSIGAGMIFSSLMAKRRDLGMLLPFLISMFMFVSPVLYPASSVPKNLQPYYSLNPLTGILECFRFGLSGNGTFKPYMLLFSFCIALLVLLIGICLFVKTISKTNDYL